MSGSLARLVVPILLARAPALRAEPAPSGTEGPWALEMQVVSAADVPVIGEVRSTTVTLGLLEDTPEAGTQHYTVCDVALAAQRGRIRSTLPDAFVRALPVRDVSVRIEDGRYRADLGVVPLGFDPEASGGVLPRHAGDPSVVDFEGDGAPGFTVHVHMPLFPTVSIHLVQVTASVLEGEQVDGDRVAGRPRVSRLEQRVLGASLPGFARSPRIRPVDGAGSFELRRLPEGSTCREVLALWGGDRA